MFASVRASSVASKQLIQNTGEEPIIATIRKNVHKPEESALVGWALLPVKTYRAEIQIRPSWTAPLLANTVSLTHRGKSFNRVGNAPAGGPMGTRLNENMALTNESLFAQP